MKTLTAVLISLFSLFSYANCLKLSGIYSCENDSSKINLRLQYSPYNNVYGMQLNDEPYLRYEEGDWAATINLLTGGAFTGLTTKVVCQEDSVLFRLKVIMEIGGSQYDVINDYEIKPVEGGGLILKSIVEGEEPVVHHC